MSSKRRLRKNGCGGKRRYASVQLAQTECNEKWKKGITLRPYRCHFCKGIHVGHLPRGLKHYFSRS